MLAKYRPLYKEIRLTDMEIRTLVRPIYFAARKLMRRWLPKIIRLRMQGVIVPLVYKLAPKTNGAIQVRGHLMYLASGGTLPPTDMSLDAFEVETTLLFERLIKPGTVVIDIGAHVGYYTMLAARAVGPTGMVYAFEPDESNYSLLIKNIEINGYSNVVALNQAVSNYLGHSTLVKSPWHSGIHHIDYGDQNQTNGVQVETTTIDSFLESLGSPVVGLVKIDVEGSEERVLDGMWSLLKQSDELNLVLEFHPLLLERAGVNPSAFLGRLAALDFEVKCIDGGNRIVSDSLSCLDSFVDEVRENGINLLCTRRQRSRIG